MKLLANEGVVAFRIELRIGPTQPTAVWVWASATRAGSFDTILRRRLSCRLSRDELRLHVDHLLTTLTSPGKVLWGCGDTHGGQPS